MDARTAEILSSFGTGALGVPVSNEALRKAEEALARHQGQVDEMIQQEQEATDAAWGDAGTGEGSGSASGSAGSSGDPGGGYSSTTWSEPLDPAESTEAGQPASGNEAAIDGSVGGGAGSRMPEDVGDGNGDDELARQLRELATKETDPELRDLYWEEYRKYKGL
jgi:hypothetical protein